MAAEWPTVLGRLSTAEWIDEANGAAKRAGFAEGRGRLLFVAHESRGSGLVYPSVARPFYGGETNDVAGVH